MAEVPQNFRRMRDRVVEAGKLVEECEDGFVDRVVGVLVESQGVDFNDVSAVLDVMHRMRKLIKLCVTGAYSDSGLMEEIAPFDEKSWKDAEKLGVDISLIKALARQIFVSSKAKSGEKIVIESSVVGREITDELVRICRSEGVDFEFEVNEKDGFDKVLIDRLDEDGVKALGDLYVSLFEEVSEKIAVSSVPNQQPSVEKNTLYRQILRPLGERIMNGTLDYVMTIVPTKKDAEFDGMDYQDYLKLYFEACEQPWEEIRKAQQILIDKFDKANELRITNDDGTNITMNITGQTFANSVVGKNIPGSEIFSSPLKEGVNGVIVAKGKFFQTMIGIVEDLRFVFKNGRIVEFSAKDEEQTARLAQIITIDDKDGEGTRFLGEIGIGTNPRLSRQFVNPLLNEKVGGSFHVAIGSCYSFDMYDGVPVNLQNGNKSAHDIHWDVTTMLKGKGGKMWLDGELVQDNGEWLVQGTAVLNDGWAVLPREERPEWFNKTLD
ncbi:aminopeptidase [Candidatus Peregrinibacteria bacterium]|nr:aminopeptidase [Candidatus Peregrinibacteria bacterium]